MPARSTSKARQQATSGILKAPPLARRRVINRRGAKRPVLRVLTKFKSKLEERIDKQITEAGFVANYERDKLHYTVPARKAKYTPDFPLGRRPIYIEAKGRFRTAAERQKMILVRDQNPGVDIRLVFQKAELPIYKGSPTTHGKWAADNGFQYADKGVVPPAWLEEAKA